MKCERPRCSCDRKCEGVVVFTKETDGERRTGDRVCFLDAGRSKSSVQQACLFLSAADRIRLRSSLALAPNPKTAGR